LPWVYKFNSIKQVLAAFFGTYIDDICGGGSSETECRRTIHHIASRVNYLGQQDAPHKRGQATQTPRAWAGAKCRAIEGDGLYVLSMKGKWSKAKNIISRLHDHIVVQKVKLLDYKTLESDVGFMCHMSRTYPIIFPYLKGFYNSLNNWRCDRDRDGWKISKTAWLELIAGNVAFEDYNNLDFPFEKRKRDFKRKREGDQPKEITSVPQLTSDLIALTKLFKPQEPPSRLVRGQSISCAIFGFGDASGGGFGSSWESNSGTAYRYGTWSRDMDDESSNLREFTNFVETLEEMGKQDNLRGREIFLFTDNSTSEAAYYNGSSRSKKLFDLVLRVKLLEIYNGIKVHIVHVAGQRMIEQGSDRLSRGNLNVSVMAGTWMLQFVPIHLSAIQCSKTLEPWIKSFVDKTVEFLSPEGWFTRGHDLDEGNWEINSDGLKLPCIKPGYFVWTQPPCAAESAVEELRRARHKRQLSHHLFIVPRLMQPLWRKHLHKAADLVLYLKPGHKAWPMNMHELLTIAFMFPFIRQKPWQLRGSIQLLALGRQLCQVWMGDSGCKRSLLWQLWGYQRKLENMPVKLASKLLQSKSIDIVSYCHPRKQQRNEVEEEKGRKEIFKCSKR
jgi:hypothetical protein